MSYIVRDIDTDQTIDSTVSVTFNQSFENESTLADITFLDSSELDKIDYEDYFEIENIGTNEIEFTGAVKEINRNEDTIELKLEERYEELINMEADGRIIYDRDSGESIQSLIEETIEGRGKRVNNNGSELTDITSNTPVFELGDFRDRRVELYGTNIIFAGFPTEETEQTEYHITFENITPHADEFTEFEIRFILNNLSGVFDLRVQYVDANNKNYTWNIGEIDGVQTQTLPVENASTEEPSGGLDSEDTTNQNKLRIIINTQGKLIEDRAIAVDAIIGKAVDIVNRENNFTTVNIPDSGRNITRRFTDTVSEAIFKILEEEDRKLLVDGDTITLKEEGESSSELSIIEGDTPVVNFNLNTNTDKIRNRVVVEGDNSIYVSERSQSSINQFGFEKTLKIRDLSIKNEANAVDKASEQLSKHAFKDTEIEITMPETDAVRNSEVGDEITIDYENINNDFIIKNIEKTDKGWTKILIDAETVRF